MWGDARSDEEEEDDEDTMELPFEVRRALLQGAKRISVGMPVERTPSETLTPTTTSGRWGAGATTLLDIALRPDPWHAGCPPAVRCTCCLACLPLSLVQAVFPPRYFTSWCHVAVILYLVLAIVTPWVDDLDDSWRLTLQGAIWVLALNLPPSSLVIMIYAPRLRRALVHACGEQGCLLHQLLTHLAPSILVFVFVPLPQPPVCGMASALFAVFLLVYNVVLLVLWHQTALDNYYVDDINARKATTAWWAVCFVLAVALAELLFVVAGSPSVPSTRLSASTWHARA